MSSQHIEITGTASRLASDTRQFVDGLRKTQELGLKLQDIYQQVASGADWAALAEKLGTSPANAEIAYNLIIAVQDDLVTSDCNAVVDRLG